MPKSLKEFLAVLAGTASVLGLVFIGIVLTLGQGWVDGNSALILTHGIYLLLLPPGLWAVRRNPEKSDFESPAVKKVLENGILLLAPCGWMGHQTAVAIYKIEDDVELFLATGRVHNIQSNGLVQVKIVAEDESRLQTARISEIKSNLRIKPGILP